MPALLAPCSSATPLATSALISTARAEPQLDANFAFASSHDQNNDFDSRQCVSGLNTYGSFSASVDNYLCSHTIISSTSTASLDSVVVSPPESRRREIMLSDIPSELIHHVFSASVDFPTCESIRMSQQADCTGERTLVVFTKADKSPEGLLEKVTAEDVNIGLGSETYEEARVAEKILFAAHPLLSKIDKSIVGIPVLESKRMQIQVQSITKCLPNIVKKINKKLNHNISEPEAMPPNLVSVVDAMRVFMQIISKASRSGTGSVFAVGVKTHGLNFTCKADPMQCSQAARRNVADGFDPTFVGQGEETVSFVQKKLMYSKNEEVGIVLLATEETKNDLQKEFGGYLHVTMDDLREVPKGTGNGDFLDAIVVGKDMLLKEFMPTNKGRHGLCLITDVRHLVKEPDEGCNANTIGQLKKSHGEVLDCIVVKVNLARSVQQTAAYENIGLLNHFSKHMIYKIIHVDGPMSLLGDLELRSIMKIIVWVYPNMLADWYKRCRIFDPGICFLHLPPF